MKNDAADAFGTEEDAFGTYLLGELDALATRPRVLLSAHSAGAVYATRLIVNDSSPEGFDLGWVATVVNYTQFAELLKNHGSKIRNFRMFGMKDSLEKADTLVGKQKWIYPRSLLYFVSGVCERDARDRRITDQCIPSMQRYCNGGYQIPRDRRIEVEEVRSFLNGGSNRVVWSIANDGLGISASTRPVVGRFRPSYRAGSREPSS